MERTCYYDGGICCGELWTCQSCGEKFCQAHYHETDKGRNVECAACENQRLRSKGERLEEKERPEEAASSSASGDILHQFFPNVID